MLAFPCLAGALRQGSGWEAEVHCSKGRGDGRRTRGQAGDGAAWLTHGLGRLPLSCHAGGGCVRRCGWGWGAGRREPALRWVLLPRPPRPSYSSSRTSTHHPRAASWILGARFHCASCLSHPGCCVRLCSWLCREVGGQLREKQRKRSPLSQTPGRHAHVYFSQKKYVLKNRVVFL